MSDETTVDLSITVGPVIVWTETTNACVCGKHDTFGKRTLVGIRRTSTPWPPTTLGGDYAILVYREDALEVADRLASQRRLVFRETDIALAEPDADALVDVLRARLANMLRDGARMHPSQKLRLPAVLLDGAAALAEEEEEARQRP